MLANDSIETVKIIDADQSITDDLYNITSHPFNESTCINELNKCHICASTSEAANNCPSACVSYFDTLPEELQCKIFSYLNPMELSTCVAPVCKYWRNLSQDPMLWQRLEFNFLSQKVNIKSLCNILERCQLTQRVSLHHPLDIGCMIPSLSKCSLLRTLEICFSDSSFNTRMMRILVEGCPLVASLLLDSCSNIDFAALAVIVEWKKLRILSLSHCMTVNDMWIELVADKCKLLEELNINGIYVISDRPIIKLLNKRRTTLRRLYLDGESLTDESYVQLASCPDITVLEISFAENITDEGLKSIKMLKLTNLKISHSGELSGPNFWFFFNGDNLKQLTHLDLDCCKNLDDAGVDSMTKSCRKLKYINLTWCWEISDVGLNFIVSRCCCLETMILTGLAEITGECLRQVPEALPNLRHLDLQQCARIIDEIPLELVRQNPHFKVIDYYGETISPEV